MTGGSRRPGDLWLREPSRTFPGQQGCGRGPGGGHRGLPCMGGGAKPPVCPLSRERDAGQVCTSEEPANTPPHPRPGERRRPRPVATCGCRLLGVARGPSAEVRGLAVFWKTPRVARSVLHFRKAVLAAPPLPWAGTPGAGEGQRLVPRPRGSEGRASPASVSFLGAVLIPSLFPLLDCLPPTEDSQGPQGPALACTPLGASDLPRGPL